MKALQIIKQQKRPMAVLEIQNYIRDNEKDLWQEMEQKCNDYVRIILSLTKNKLISKYKPVHPVPGIDKRATFYGIASEKYPNESWIKLGSVKEEKIPVAQIECIDDKQDSSFFDNFSEIYNPQDDDKKLIETK
ncbi:hypothetical protein TVAG_483850 [Trichomonas vaginalis G3]|uniref:Uncharacterized protein n=1 Tax=Trichomonas vaginalis (strain ATCC PRA-98 / G3) TaxID=412133 RepID=A2EA28_TRIV3|nr:hypothetical protein TVAGG3_0981010 [Trichomonas vaginalis G3]EAY10474.1 hypothetical protein TVAG_483850 [Trichomonas vaginalis G3]KAI5489298.1 hypothetical protein TVAGG3_0981010 [Trichomonas vaginalis G3]|eukprot:XP_001322697.1 hypothetical protein [Trichomonas vaginalis G3]